MHLNYSGASKVTKWLGQYLKNNYMLDDYTSNVSWEMDYLAYFEYKKEILKAQDKLVNYLVQLRDDDFTVEAEIYDTNLMNSERLMHLYDNAGINPVLVNGIEDICASLIVKNSETGEVVDKVSFRCGNTDKLDIFSIVKDVEK